MVEITPELYDKYNQRFPETMSYKDIANELDRMNPKEAEEYDAILCNEVFHACCSDYLQYNRKKKKTITELDEYRIFRKRSANLSSSYYYEAWKAFLENRKQDAEVNIHKFVKSLEDKKVPIIEYVIALLVYAFKNAYKGFWGLVKKEIRNVPHDDFAIELCDIIDTFYSAESDDDALSVLTAAFQKHPESPTINEMLGITYFNQKQYGNAVAAFERLYDKESDSYDAVLNSEDTILFCLAFACEKLKERKQAILYYEKALRIDPFSPFVASNLGYAYYRDRQYDKAYAILQRCMDEKLESNMLYPVNHFARLLYAMGRYHEAKVFIKNAPARVEKYIRDKIENAPDQDMPGNNAQSSIDESEEVEPVVKPMIERKKTQFQSEKVLEDELTMRIEAGMEVFGHSLKIYRRHGEYGRQYIFPEGRLDILAEDADGNLFIIELKKDCGYDDAYKQITEYINWFQTHKAKKKKVYGIICLNSPRKALIDAVRKDERVSLFEYQISYSEIK